MSYGPVEPTEPHCAPGDHKAAYGYAVALANYIDSTLGELSGPHRSNLRRKLSKWYKRALGESPWFEKHGNAAPTKVHAEHLPPGLGKEPWVGPHDYDRAWERYWRYDEYLKKTRGKISKPQRAYLRRRKAMWKKYASGQSEHFDHWGSGRVSYRDYEREADLRDTGW